MNDSERRSVSLGFTRERFPEGTHMCLIYNDEKERRKIMRKYVESGLLDKENVFYFADTAKPEEINDWLMKMGLDISEESDELFEVKRSKSAYCPTGTFSPEDMYDRLRKTYIECREAGHPGVRVTGEMGWALLGLPGTVRLMEYESYVNILFNEYPICCKPRNELLEIFRVILVLHNMPPYRNIWWAYYRLWLLEASGYPVRNKLIVFANDYFGIFPSHEVFMLANVPVRDTEKELNITRQQVYAKYSEAPDNKKS